MNLPNVILIIGPSLLALAAAVIGIFNRNAIHEVHQTFNSKMDRLLELTAAAAKAEGRLEGVASEQKRIAALGADAASQAEATRANEPKPPAVK